MTDDREVYSYSDKSLLTKTDWYYFYSRTNEIVIMDISEDGKALYVRYPSTISGTGYRDCWFAAKDIWGDIDLNLDTFSPDQKTKIYRIEQGNTLIHYGTMPVRLWTTYQKLGEHWTGNNLVIYTMANKKTVLGIDTTEQMALLPN